MFLRKRFAVLQKIFAVLQEIFAVLQEIFAVLQEIFAVLQEIFAVLQKLFAVLQKIFAVLHAIFAVSSTGKMVCTGAKSEQDSKLAARKYARIIQKLGFPVSGLFLVRHRSTLGTGIRHQNQCTELIHSSNESSRRGIRICTFF